MIELKGEKEIARKRYVIDTPKSIKTYKSEQFRNKVVVCKGQILEKKWKINPDDGGQHPVTSFPTVKGEEKKKETPKETFYACILFRITEIKVMDE